MVKCNRFNKKYLKTIAKSLDRRPATDRPLVPQQGIDDEDRGEQHPDEGQRHGRQREIDGQAEVRPEAFEE